MRGPPGGDLVTPEYEVVWNGRDELIPWPVDLRSSCTLACAAGKTVDDISEFQKVNGARAAAIRDGKLRVYHKARGKHAVPSVAQVRAKVQGLFLDFQRRGDQ